MPSEDSRLLNVRFHSHEVVRFVVLGDPPALSVRRGQTPAAFRTVSTLLSSIDRTRVSVARWACLRDT
ncbi:hypothetical protein KEK_14863 [Mycolicibacterium thermoresistibile ATCC 19527]|uniref:Uncharacterized protein n=1 Tax=Mycolicibacterium thermoresistibile (strain ATCC 19527 / DSM 44167 / CIP 105390 / JCM 6362 / NCTC 10409 / 316) TaxID=1078020 RepID=G7CH80_MYCT3|nr:hypothetical protein KEK_14863 [Mycolicibacterium thermoresistibile ATCC 19527]